MRDVQQNQGLLNSVHMLTNEWTFIKTKAAEFELHKLYDTRSSKDAFYASSTNLARSWHMGRTSAPAYGSATQHTLHQGSG